MRAIAAPIMAIALVAAPAASAQSMNIPLITRLTLTEICGPYLQTGDVAASVQAGLANRYRVAPTVDPANPPSLVVLDGSLVHRGKVILINDNDQVCSVDMAEGGVAQVSDLAAETLTALGMRRVFVQGGPTLGVIVWAGEDRQAVIAPSDRSSGVAITLSWRRRD